MNPALKYEKYTRLEARKTQKLKKIDAIPLSEKRLKEVEKQIGNRQFNFAAFRLQLAVYDVLRTEFSRSRLQSYNEKLTV